MKKVNLYIATSIKRPVRQNGRWIYILEATTAKGKPTLTYGEDLEDTTENQLALSALEKALMRIHEPCYIEIHTDCAYVAATLQNGWLKDWEYAGWVNKKRQPVKDVEKWSHVSSLLVPHVILVHLKEEHEYKEWMDKFVMQKEDIKKCLTSLSQEVQHAAGT